MTTLNNDFVDAQLMYQRFPQTFEVPDPKRLKALKIGDQVKICANNERFWTQVIRISGHVIEAIVMNDLISNGWLVGEPVVFERDNIYAID